MTFSPALPVRYTYKSVSDVQSVIINSGQGISTILDLGGMQPRGILIPSSFTFCNIGFNVSMDGTNFYTLCNIDNTTLLIAIARQGGLPLLPYIFDQWKYIQLVCSVNQSVQVTLPFVLMPLYQGIHN